MTYHLYLSNGMDFGRVPEVIIQQLRSGHAPQWIELEWNEYGQQGRSVINRDHIVEIKMRPSKEA